MTPGERIIRHRRRKTKPAAAYFPGLAAHRGKGIGVRVDLFQALDALIEAMRRARSRTADHLRFLKVRPKSEVIIGIAAAKPAAAISGWLIASSSESKL